MKAEDWLERAQTWLQGAQHLVEIGDFEMSLFGIHQSIELALKAVFVARSGRLPPRVHQLRRLAEHVGYTKRVASLEELDPIYCAARYPELDPIPVDEQKATAGLALAEEVLKWSTSQVPSRDSPRR